MGNARGDGQQAPSLQRQVTRGLNITLNIAGPPHAELGLQGQRFRAAWAFSPACERL
jgi:hypothetical protein